MSPFPDLEIWIDEIKMRWRDDGGSLKNIMYSGKKIIKYSQVLYQVYSILLVIATYNTLQCFS